MRINTLADKKKKEEFQPINTSDMHVTPDGQSVRVGSRVFKRTVLPSSAAPKRTKDEVEAEALLDELTDQE